MQVRIRANDTLRDREHRFDAWSAGGEGPRADIDGQTAISTSRMWFPISGIATWETS